MSSDTAPGPSARNESQEPSGRKRLQCEMEHGCQSPVTHVGEKGFIYCESHGADRRKSGIERCRRLRAWELKLLRDGKALPSYKPIRKPAASPVTEGTASKGKPSVPVLTDVTVEIHSETGKSGASISAIGPKGNRYHVWASTTEPMRRERVLYCNPPLHLKHGDPGYFRTRRYELGTHYKGMDAIADEMMRVAAEQGLLAKARAAFDAKQAEEARQADLRRRDNRARDLGPELLGVLKALTGWAREHTSPTDADSPHEILIAAQDLIVKAGEAGIDSRMPIPKGTSVRILTTNGGEAEGALLENYVPSFAAYIARPGGLDLIVPAWRIKSIEAISCAKERTEP